MWRLQLEIEAMSDLNGLIEDIHREAGEFNRVGAVPWTQGVGPLGWRPEHGGESRAVYDVRAGESLVEVKGEIPGDDPWSKSLKRYSGALESMMRSRSE